MSSSRSKEPKLVDYVLLNPDLQKSTKDRIYGLLYKYTKTKQPTTPSKSSKLFSIPENHTIEDREAIEALEVLEVLEAHEALEELDKRDFIINVILIFILICTSLYLYIYCTKQLAELAELAKLTKLLNYFR
jgi:hypothetical protein